VHTKRWATWCMAFAFLIGTGSATAQNDESYWATAALAQGTLTIWVVKPSPKQAFGTGNIKDLGTFRSQTAGSFGQTSSTYGEAASDHGQTASSYGQNASTYGQAAGDHGQAAGSFGQTASSYGQAASDTGQTAGSFGHSLSNIADAETTDAQAVDAAEIAAEKNAARHAPQPPDPFRDLLRTELKADFSGIQVNIVTVFSDQLKDWLTAEEGQTDYPDVLVGDPLPSVWWSTLAHDLGVVVVGKPNHFPLEDVEPLHPTLSASLETAILLRAPHSLAARAYVLWIEERGHGNLAGMRLIPDTTQAPVAVALAAVNSVMGGNSIGSPDLKMATFSPALARLQALGTPSVEPLGELNLHVDVLNAGANSRFAVVQLRAIVSSENAFGVMHPLVVLRRSDDGNWKVLQFTPSLDSDLLDRANTRLQPYTVRVARAKLVQVGDVTQSTPSDNDVRPPTPELAWDNGGGGNLLIVEWQRHGGTDWMGSWMYFVTEGEVRSQTRATARFAARQGIYRWRVWNLGTGGMLKLSSWRTMNITGQ